MTIATNRSLAERFLDECLSPPALDALERWTANQRVVAIFGAFAAAYPDARFTADWITADDDSVVIGGRVTATHEGDWRGVAATGRPVDFAAVVSLALEGGSIADIRVVSDTLAIAEQIGAVDPLGPKACQLLR